MAETLAFELVSPERLLVSEPVEMVVVPGAEGDFAAMPRHAPVLSALRAGVIEIHRGGQASRRIFVAGGFAEVTPERCTVLAEEAVPLAELDAAQAAALIQAAEREIAEAQGDDAKALARERLAIAEALRAALGAAPPAAH